MPRAVTKDELEQAYEQLCVRIRQRTKVFREARANELEHQIANYDGDDLNDATPGTSAEGG